MHSIARNSAFLLWMSLLMLTSTAWIYGQGAGGRSGPTYDVSGISYQTEDGWTIHGTLLLPKATPPAPIPAIVMMSEPGLRIRTIYDPYLARPLAEQGKIAVLTIDPRGTAGSYGRKDFEKFTMKELEGFRLDFKGAVKFLATQRKVDAARVALMASGIAADSAVLEAADNPSVQGLILVTPELLSRESQEFLQFHSEIPVLTLIGGDRKKSLQKVWMEPYFLSENRNSDVLFGVGEGPEMLHRPGGLGESVSKWLMDNLSALGTKTDVTFKSQDGTTLHGSLYVPDNIAPDAKVPGVVMAHGRNHSQQSWLTLPREVVKQNMAVLIFDLRGVRKSFTEGQGEVGVDQSNEESNKAYQDIKAAVNFLASQPRVDANRTGLVSATAVNNHAARAAIGDSRIKTIVSLSFYPPDPDVKQFLQTSDVSLFTLASTEDRNPDGTSLAEGSRLAFQLSKSKESQFILYDDAGRGHGILRSKPETVGMIVRWLGDRLAAASGQK
jgi:dienelactone hydrolase